MAESIHRWCPGGGWPDLRSRPSLLIPTDCTRMGLAIHRGQRTSLRRRRLFYVACTRAQDSLVVTAVANAGRSATSGEQPSRFLAELTGDGTTVRTTHEPGYQLSSLNMSSVVAALRATLEAPGHRRVSNKRRQRPAQLAHGGVGAADLGDGGVLRIGLTVVEVRPSGEPLHLRVKLEPTRSMFTCLVPAA